MGCDVLRVLRGDLIQVILHRILIMAEKLCLQWNDFKQNISTSFRNLRGNKEFTDVTLACEDGQQIEAHKAILASSSPFFKELLMKNKHPHPLPVSYTHLTLPTIYSV